MKTILELYHTEEFPSVEIQLMTGLCYYGKVGIISQHTVEFWLTDEGSIHINIGHIMTVRQCSRNQ